MRHLMRSPRGLADGRQRGVTLIELLVGFAITAILVAAGVPYYADYIINARLREAGNVLQIEALFAQSEAVKRNAPSVEVRIDGGTMTTFDTTPGIQTPTIRVTTLPEPVAAAASGVIGFRSDGRPTAFPDTTQINLAISGHTCSDDVRCPALIVEGSGLVRLCRNRSAGC